MSGPHEFVLRHTLPVRPPMVAEIELRLATEITPIWQATETWLAAANIAPPYWAFAWPGGQALARHALDRPGSVQGRRVLDFAAGCGIAAIACRRAGAAAVTATEIDPLAAAAIALNAAANEVAIDVRLADVVGELGAWDLVLCGDVCYECAMSSRVLRWLRRLAATTEVWLADPGRAYAPRGGMAAIADYVVPTSLELEDRTERRVTIWRLPPDADREADPRASPAPVRAAVPGIVEDASGKG